MLASGRVEHEAEWLWLTPWYEGEAATAKGKGSFSIPQVYLYAMRSRKT